MGTIEILGILLIFIGIIYTFLQGMGKLSDKGGEIETKILSLKGGAGLIFVALGIVLLSLGGGIQLPSDLLEKLLLPEEIKANPGMTTPAKTPTSIPTSQSLSGRLSPIPTEAMPTSKTIVIKPVGKESGSVFAGRSVNTGTQNFFGIGEDNDVSYQSFLSFNIAGITANATITNATLDFSNYDRIGDPFSYLGCLGIYIHDYGAPDIGDFVFGTPTGAIEKWCSDGELSEPSSSMDLISALQHKLGKSRFQIRIQFDKANIDDGHSDRMYLMDPKLIVTYTVP